jgi:hypothetical protein
MKKVTISKALFILLGLVTFYSCSKDNTFNTASPVVQTKSVSQYELQKNVTSTVTVLASDLAYPRGIKFGPDGNLYVALAGTGGTTSTAGQCGEVVAPPVQALGGYTSSLIKVNLNGGYTTVVDKLPSAVNGFGDMLGLADVAFVGNTIYGLVVAGCSHGNIDVPSSVVRMDPENDKWTVVADMSAYLHNNKTAVIEPDDFEPDGSAYSMLNVRGDLYVLEPNHGEMVKITTDGNISRVLDFSAHYGHIVPTAMAYEGNFFVGNLSTFPLAVGNSNIYKVTPSGEVKVWATGFTSVLGVAFDQQHRMYVLESSPANGFPTPNVGRVVRVNNNDTRDLIVDKLNFPTGMTFGPDGALYISDSGYGPPTGRVLKVVFTDN